MFGMHISILPLNGRPTRWSSLEAMTLDTGKLLLIARNLSDFGVALQSRTAPPDASFYRSLGQAFVDVSEAVGDLTTKR